MDTQEPNRLGPLREAVRSHPFAIFVGVTLVLTWAFWMLPVLEQAGYLETAPLWWGVGSFGPSVSGMILAFVVGGRRRLTALLRATVRWRVHPAWYAAAVLVPLAVAAPALLVHRAAGDPVAWSELPSPALLPVLFLQIFFLGGPLNEELGWRGFALPELQRRHSALVSSLILGAVWAGWHLPLFWAGAAGYTALPFHWYVVKSWRSRSSLRGASTPRAEACFWPSCSTQPSTRPTGSSCPCWAIRRPAGRPSTC